MRLLGSQVFGHMAAREHPCMHMAAWVHEDTWKHPCMGVTPGFTHDAPRVALYLCVVVYRVCIGEQVALALIRGDEPAARARHLALAAPWEAVVGLHMGSVNLDACIHELSQELLPPLFFSSLDGLQVDASWPPIRGILVMRFPMLLWADFRASALGGAS